MELMFLIVPEDKRRRKHRVIVAIIAIVFTLGLMALGLWGVYLIADRENLWGILPLAAAILLSIVQITAGIILYNKRDKKRRRIE
ncbi:MAG: hypothetical protein IJX30_01040 [Clostridia bacterium]|nr:hypothetical protein [Clostridia bacterium]